MIFEVYSEEEIRQKYNRATNKMDALRVIADLTVSTVADVAKFLGVVSPKKKMDLLEAQRLYDAGNSDKTIAELLGVTRAAVYNWRRINDLPSNTCRADHEKRMEAYKRGLSDGQAAEELDIGKTTFRDWRRKNGLKPNGGKTNE